MSGIDIDTAGPGDVALMLDWAAVEGWNPGLDDAGAFFDTDPSGFFVARDGSGVVASISVVNHSPFMAFLGLFICRPDRRGKGIGRALWTHALRHAGDRTVGLDGVAAQEAAYGRSGFVRESASIRLIGALSPAQSSGLREAAATDAASIERSDRDATGYARPRFIRAWTAPGKRRRTVVMPDGSAFATVRRCRKDCKIGPIVAPDASVALDLARHALTLLNTDLAIIDVPDDSPLAAALTDIGFEETFRTARMYRGKAPLGNGRQLSIASMELG